MSKTLASYCVLVNKTDTCWELSLEKNQQPLLQHGLCQQIEQAINATLGHTIKLSINLSDSTAQLPSPANLATTRHQQAIHQAKQQFAKDPNVITLQHQFNARIQDDTITLVEQ